MAIKVDVRGLGDVHPDRAVAAAAERKALTSRSAAPAAIVRTPPMPIPTAMLASARGAGTQGAGGFGVFRPHQGPHGTWHWGLDVPFDHSNAGSVVAPERMTVTHVWTDNVTPPFVGYGPAGLVGKGESGVFHLLGHLDPAGWTGGAGGRPAVGQTFDAGELVGLDSEAVGHVHWEVRTLAVDEGPATRAAFTINPVVWLDGGSNVVLDRDPGVPWWVWLLGLYVVSRLR